MEAIERFRHVGIHARKGKCEFSGVRKATEGETLAMCGGLIHNGWSDNKVRSGKWEHLVFDDIHVTESGLEFEGEKLVFPEPVEKRLRKLALHYKRAYVSLDVLLIPATASLIIFPSCTHGGSKIISRDPFYWSSNTESLADFDSTRFGRLFGSPFAYG